MNDVFVCYQTIKVERAPITLKRTHANSCIFQLVCNLYGCSPAQK